MARINMDDEMHAWEPFKRLVRHFKDEDKAAGMLYRFWRRAQDFWGDGEKLMPENEFEADGFHVLLEVGAAERRGDGIYAHGADERFAWYVQKCEASKAAVKSRSENRKTRSGTPEPQSRSTGAPIPNNPPASVPVPSTASVPVPSTATATATATATVRAEDVKHCVLVWRDTLKAMGQPRPIAEGEDKKIGEAVQLYGALLVELALVGIRHEPKTERFNPADHVHLERILRADRFNKFAGLGAAAAERERQRQARIATVGASISKARDRPDLEGEPERETPRSFAEIQAEIRRRFPAMGPVKPPPREPQTPEEIGNAVEASLRDAGFPSVPST